MMPLTAALVLSSRPLWEQAHACIQNLPVRVALEQHETPDADSLLDRIERHRTDVVLLEASSLPMPLEEFMRRLRDASPLTAVFVLHPEASPQQILEALRAGATEFLYPPLVKTLRTAFENLSDARSKNSTRQAGGLGRIFGFISAKGGCGATTFCAHVAAGLAKQMKQPILLADLDFEAGLLRFITKAKSTYSIKDAYDNMHRMDANFWKALVSTQGTHLDVITSPDELTARQAPGSGETAPLMRFLRGVYPAVIVDFGRHLSLLAFDALPELETLYVVSTLELETLDHARDCLRSAAERGFGPSRVKVLLNRLPQRNAPDLKGIETFLGAAPAGVLISDYSSLYDAWSEGRLISGDTRLGREFSALATTLATCARGDQDQPAATSQTRPAGVKKFFGFLQRTGK